MASADQTELVRELELINAELTAENARLSEAVSARDAFLAIAAHELRNPMSPIALRLHLLRHLNESAPVPNPKMTQIISVMEKSIAVFIRRASTLLDITRVSSGAFTVHTEAVDVVAVARSVIDDLNLLSSDAHAALRVDADGALLVHGDALAIEQIIENLVSNGIKYGEGSPVVVSIGADADRGMALIKVSDGGPGISPSNQARIFGQFERAVLSTSHTGGFGVGLWLVQQLSVAMGGSVGVTSAPGKGSTFCVSLPLHCPGETA